jgi:hypothetical protein
MQYYAGIDVSLEQCSVCVVDVAGKIVKEAILHRMWIDGTSFRWSNKEKAAAHA